LEQKNNHRYDLLISCINTKKEFCSRKSLIINICTDAGILGVASWAPLNNLSLFKKKYLLSDPIDK